MASIGGCPCRVGPAIHCRNRAGNDPVAGIYTAAMTFVPRSGARQPEPNFDESRVPDYRLPALLVGEDGTDIETALQWRRTRRPEILRLFEEHVYGRRPAARYDVQFDITERSDRALAGTARRRQVDITCRRNGRSRTFKLLIYLPAASRQRVPLFLGLNFHGNQTIANDPAIELPDSWIGNDPDIGITGNRASERSRGRLAGRWPLESIIGRGYGLATIYCGDIDPDVDDGFQSGVHRLFPEFSGDPEQPHQWGTIAGWAWGLSRALDYFDTDQEVDRSRIALLGHSRLGKTALWAGASDERFALVVSNNSGCGGAALSRRRFGETVRRINDAFPHWFCDNFKNYNGREDELPVDQHMLIGLIAPRPVYIASASDDLWADPRGEFLAALHAEPAYQLLGRQGLGRKSPGHDRSVGGAIGYHLRTGGHDVTESDWQCFLDFADRHLTQ